MYSLTPVNLSTIAVNGTGTLSLANIGGGSGASAHPQYATTGAGVLWLHNESGSGLACTFRISQKSFILPAGGWYPATVPPGEINLDFIVLYLLPSPPVQLLLATYYGPGETPPQQMTLGNSPIGIGGTVSTSGVQTLSNETNAAGTLVIDIGATGHTNQLQIWNDHFIWSVLQSGVSHQVLKGNTSGNPLQIGQSGDISEVLGNLTVDGTSILTGNVSATNMVNPGTGNTWASISGATSATEITRIQSGNQVKIQGPAGTDIATFTATGLVTALLGALNVTGLVTASSGLTQTGVLSSTGGAQTITGNANGSLHLGTTATGDVLDITVNGSNYDTHLKASGNVIVEVPSGTQVAKFANANLATILLGLLDIEQAAIGGVRNGSVAGTLTGFCPIWGAALKVFIATYNGYNSANVQSFSFPSNPSRGLAFSGNMGAMTCTFFLSGVAQNVNAITALGTLAANGTFSANGTSIHAGDFIHFFTPADSIQFGSTAAAVVNGIFIFVGI